MSVSSSTLTNLVPANDSTAASSETRLPEHEVDFAELDDGTLIEMIEDPNNAAKSLFAVYQNGTVNYAAAVERGDRVLVPVPREQGLFKHVRFLVELSRAPRRVCPWAELERLSAHVLTLVRTTRF